MLSDNKILLFSLLSALLSFCCGPDAKQQTTWKNSDKATEVTDVICGADRLALYYPSLEGKRVALVVNQTSMVGHMHLVDTLLEMDVNLVKIFAPEHGFRGQADAGAKVADGRDSKTGLPIVSLYGKNKKPSPAQLADVDVVVFDIQDVGVRFYTYISTLSLVMEACAEAATPIVVLDRPNPNGNYIDGPVMQDEYKSFVGMHNVPIVYGMTIGEYAKMVNGEGWLGDGLTAALTVIPCKNYDHETYYNLPIPPSPNLPNIQSILLYPSLCAFEGTTVSVGRGTDGQFQRFGHPDFPATDFAYTPEPGPGAKYPKHQGKSCFGDDLSKLTKGSLHQRKALNWTYLEDAYARLGSQPSAFFNANNFFEKLMGTTDVRQALTDGRPLSELKSTWQADIDAFKSIRSKYLIYP